MPSKKRRKPILESDVQRLLDKSIRQPGVADMIEIYDRAEAFYQQISSAAFYPEITTNSTTDPLL